MSKLAPIEGYTNYYSINTSGEVISMDRTISLPNGNTRRIYERVLRPKCNAQGYYFVSLSKNGITQNKYIHRLVAETFIPNPENLPQVNHLAGKSQNSVEQLEWVNAKDNALHAYKTGLNKNTGENHNFAASVIDNELGQTFDTIKAWCFAREINYNTGRNILSGSNKSTIIDLTQIFKQKSEKSN